MKIFKDVPHKFNKMDMLDIGFITGYTIVSLFIMGFYDRYPFLIGVIIVSLLTIVIGYGMMNMIITFISWIFKRKEANMKNFKLFLKVLWNNIKFIVDLILVIVVFSIIVLGATFMYLRYDWVAVLVEWIIMGGLIVVAFLLFLSIIFWVLEIMDEYKEEKNKRNK